MKLELTRIARKPGYTIGRLCYNGRRICDTLEPRWRDLRGKGRKVAGQTAIPEGRYRMLIVRSPKFRRWLPLLLGVPQFSGILIHPGNTVNDTRGCILVGDNTREGWLDNSRAALTRVMNVLGSRQEDEKMWIEIRDFPCEE